MLSAFPRAGVLPPFPLRGSGMTDAAPAFMLDLARQLNSIPLGQRRPLMDQIKAQYGPDMAYQISMEAVYLVVWPEDPAAFRAQWGAPSVKRPDIRETVLALPDHELERLSSLLRWTQAQYPDEVEGVWELMGKLAGVA